MELGISLPRECAEAKAGGSLEKKRRKLLHHDWTGLETDRRRNTRGEHDLIGRCFLDTLYSACNFERKHLQNTISINTCSCTYCN